MFTKNNLKTNAVSEAVAKILEAELDEGSGPKEKQKTPYRNINSTEYKAAADKQKEKMKKDDASEPGKKLLGRQHKLDKNHNGKLDAHDFKLLRGEKPVEEAALGVPLKGHEYHKKTDAELRYIQKDAAEAAKAMKGHAPNSEAKYLDQVNDASTVLYYRGKGGKQLAKEEVEIDEAAKWRQGYSASGHPPGYKHKSGETGPLGGTYTNEPSGYDGDTSKSPVNKYRDAADPLASRDKTKLSTTGKKLLARNAMGNLKAAITRSKGTHGPVSKLPEENEIDEADNLTMRGLFTANPGSIPDYQRSTEKGKKSMADKNKPVLKDLIKRQLGKHPKPNLPEAVEKPTHIVSKELLSDHKRWMDSEGFDTHTVPLPKSHPKHATHVGIVAKNNNEAGYHEDGFARPIKESAEGLDELSKGTLSSYAMKSGQRLGGNIASLSKTKDISKFSANPTTPDEVKNRLQQHISKRTSGLAGASKRLAKEEINLDEDLKGDMHPDADKVLKHIKPEFHGTYKPFLKKGMYKGNYADRAAVLNAAEKAGHTLNEKKGDSDLGTFTDNNMGEMSDAQMKKRETIVKGMKKGLAGFKERYGKRAKDVMYATATKQAMKDEAVDPEVKTTDTLAGRVKGGTPNLHTSYKVKLKTEAMGCENTPMSRATNLAKAAYKKLKNETMMGKAGGTSEEKE